MFLEACSRMDQSTYPTKTMLSKASCRKHSAALSHLLIRSSWYEVVRYL